MLKHPQRLAQGRAADLELTREGQLGGSAGGDLAAEDVAAQALVDVRDVVPVAGALSPAALTRRERPRRRSACRGLAQWRDTDAWTASREPAGQRRQPSPASIPVCPAAIRSRSPVDGSDGGFSRGSR